MDNKTVGMLNGIGLDAKVNMDDVVNIFISRYETSLNDQFLTTQAALKEHGKKMAALDLEALAKIKEDFVQEDTIVCSNGLFETKQSFGQVTILWPEHVIQFEIKQTSVAAPGCKMVSYYEVENNKTTFNIRANLHENFVSAWKRLNEEGNQLREELMSINQKLQQVDRKARQIKGLIAEKKLESAGMTDLLNNTELAQLVQIN